MLLGQLKSFISSFSDTGAFKAFKSAIEDAWGAVKTIGSSIGDVFSSSEMQTIISAPRDSLWNVNKMDISKLFQRYLSL